MKPQKLIACCVAAWLTMSFSTIHAQFGGVRSLFTMSTFLDNPAAAGNSPCLEMRMGTRSQWAGFEGAPLSNFASLSARLGQGASFAHGIGGYVVTDDIGPWSNTRFNMAYSTKVKLTNGARLSAGLAAGVVQYRLDVGSLQFPNGGSSDLTLSNQTSQVVFPTMDVGVWYEDRHTFAALAIQNLKDSPLQDLASQSSADPVYVFTGGRVVTLDRRFKFRPSLQLRKTNGLPVSVDVQGAFSLHERVSMGAGYRTGSALVGTMSLKLFDSMTVGYAYDFGVSSLNVASRNTHEIVISLSACDKEDPFNGPNGRCSAYD